MPIDLSQLNSQSIIFGGLTLVSLSLVSVIVVVVQAYFKQSQNYYNHTNDVINRNTDAWIQHIASSQRQADTLDRVIDVIEKFHQKKDA